MRLYHFLQAFTFSVVLCIPTISKACSPLVIPTLLSQTFVGNTIVFNWQSNTTYQCNGYYMQVEIACLTSSFTGVAPFFQSPAMNKTMTPMPFPTQTISLSSLCPGTTYIYRAREVYPPSTFSGWTQTYTITTPGVFVQPTLNLSGTSVIVCPPQTSTLSASLLNDCGDPSFFSYAWTPLTSLSSTNTASTIASPSANIIYTCTVNGGKLGCWTVAKTITLSLNTAPPTFGPAQVAPATICVGKTSVISLPNVVGNVQWQSGPSNSGPWTNLTGAVSPTIISPPLFGNTCFQAIVSSCTSTLNSAIVCVTTNSVPVLTATVLQTNCTNTAAIAGFSNPGSSGTPTSIVWSPLPLSINGNSTVASYTYFGPASFTASFPDGCVSVSTFSIDPFPPLPTFTLVNSSGSNSITCATPTINVAAMTNYTFGSISYFWSSPSATFASNAVGIVNPGNYVVASLDPVTNCSVTRTISIGVNTVSPLSAITPSFQNITCSISSIALVNATALSPTVNITHQIMSPLGTTLSATTGTMTYVAGGPGTYTHCLVNNDNGCSTCKQFTVFSNVGFPTFSVVSAQNFSLGCGTRSVANISIINGATTPVPGGPISYTLLGPPTSTVYTPGAGSTYTVNVPGTWTVVTRDNTTMCESKLPFSILSNTFAPAIDSVIVPRNVLDCATPQVTLQGVSSTQNINYNWTFPGIPGNQPGSTLVVANGTLAPTATLVANYTLTVTDKSSTCFNTTVVPIYQNKYLPNAKITNGGVSAISCKTPTLTLTNSSSTGIPANSMFPSFLPVIGAVWQGPNPQVTFSNVSTYLAYMVGEFTLTVLDLNNGCTSKTVIAIADDRDYPVVNNPVKPANFIIDCGASSASITPIITSPTNALTYQWFAVPGASITGADNKVALVNEPGEYQVLVTNTLNGCSSSGLVFVVNGTLQAGFTPEKLQGFAPLTIAFSNDSRTSVGNGSISSAWSFGNGTSSLTAGAHISPSTTYKFAGTYSVTMFSYKGPCMDTIVKTILVEIPSELEIPNIFTPNNDGVNDEYFIKAANIAEISMQVLDRWGQIVFEVSSQSGNVVWDGKNQKGIEVADGVYYYTLVASGKDGIDYKKSGTITITR
ncbi:MAG: gliding motility-associated C-terminal domain-containing protein [bacterium]|nr:gliding motility-associated C-terminal domain-containing protein [bacterium]